MRANGVVHERFLGLFRWGESSFMAFRFKAWSLERQRVAKGLCRSRYIRVARLQRPDALVEDFASPEKLDSFEWDVVQVDMVM